VNRNRHRNSLFVTVDPNRLGHRSLSDPAGCM
jgi:hypothetical protein